MRWHTVRYEEEDTRCDASVHCALEELRLIEE